MLKFYLLNGINQFFNSLLFFNVGLKRAPNVDFRIFDVFYQEVLNFAGIFLLYLSTVYRRIVVNQLHGELRIDFEHEEDEVNLLIARVWEENLAPLSIEKVVLIFQ